MESGQQVTMPANRMRKLHLTVAGIVAISVGCGCSSAGKTNYLRHLSTSLEPTMVTMHASDAPGAVPTGPGERMVAAADDIRSTQSR